MQFYIVDEKNNKYYAWENKDSYNLNGIKKVNVKLLSKEQINYSDDKYMDVDLNKQ